MVRSFREEYYGKVECEFKAEEPLSKVYKLLDEVKERFHIESYGVSNQNKLVTIFLDRVEQSIEEAGDDGE